MNESGATLPAAESSTVEALHRFAYRRVVSAAAATGLAIAMVVLNVVIIQALVAAKVSSLVAVDAEQLTGDYGIEKVYYLDQRGTLQTVPHNNNVVYPTRTECGRPSLASLTTTTTVVPTTPTTSRSSATSRTIVSFPSSQTSAGNRDGCITAVSLFYDPTDSATVALTRSHRDDVLPVAGFIAAMVALFGLAMSYFLIRQLIGLSRLHGVTAPSEEIWYVQIWTQFQSNPSSEDHVHRAALFRQPPSPEDVPQCTVELDEAYAGQTGSDNGGVFAAKVWGDPSVGRWFLIQLGSLTIVPTTPGRSSADKHDRPRLAEDLVLRELSPAPGLKGAIWSGTTGSRSRYRTAIALGAIALVGLGASWALVPAMSVAGGQMWIPIYGSFVAILIGYAAALIASPAFSSPVLPPRQDTNPATA